jgi:hypothetical protein
MDARFSPERSNWKQLYIGALFESDRTKLAARIAEARAAIVYRARDLFRDPCDHIEEGQALDDALYALDALAHCYLPEQERRPAA